MRTHIYIAVCLLALFLLGVPSHLYASPKALLLFDGKADATNDGFLGARYAANLLGHFDVQYKVQPLDGYRRGSLAPYDLVFFTPGNVRPNFPAGFLDEVAGRKGTTVWLGRHIGDLLSGPRAAGFGFRYVDYLDDEEFRSVVYRNVRLPKGDPDLNLTEVTDGNRVRVHAVAQSEGGALFPYALQNGNFWYFADSPFSYSNEGDRYLVFCDLLHDILGQPHATSRRAMVRIEDVSVEDDPQELRAIADYLYSQGIPFQIALIPIFRDPERSLEVYLSDRRQFTEAIRYMVLRGGSVVMHGVTHQYRGVSADDYEFWNALTNRPVANDANKDGLERKMRVAFQECFKNGIYPIAWETPHNAGSANTYGFLKDYFSVFHERVLAASGVETEQYFPYPVRDIYGRFVVPENLGFIPITQPGVPQPITPSTIVDHARSMLAVRDGIATFYFHPFMKLGDLRDMVSGIQALDYQFISLRQFAPRAQFGPYQVAVADEKGNVRFDSRAAGSGPVHRVAIAPDGTVRDERLEAGDAARQTSGFEKEAVVAWEPARGPRTAAPSLLARLKEWVFGNPQRETAAAPSRDLPAAALLWNPAAAGAALAEQNSFQNLLQTYGYTVERLGFRIRSAQRLGAPGRMIVIPAYIAPQLSPQQQLEVLDHVRAGGKLILAGRSPLAERLGIAFEQRTIAISRVTDVEYAEQAFRWEPAEKLQPFEPPDDAAVFMLDSDSRQPVAFSGVLGDGRYVYLAVPLDTTTSLGIARFPYLAQHLEEAFSVRPRVTRPAIEAYFDPGYRSGQDRGRLINSWRRSGIRAVHVAAWHFWPSYSYPYADFIRECHQNGIAVYAWFEPPMVSKRFWDEHPEWREKTASGADGRVGWRYLMNLRNPQALQAALAFFREKMQFDWDGVNLAELNFDAADNLMDPQKFVPMNADVRGEFQRLHGFDPMLLFDANSPYFFERNATARKAFLEYRIRLVTELHRAYFDEIKRIRAGRDFEVVVTMLDSLHSKKLRAAAGVDSQEIARLVEQYGFTLQVEDPSEFWASSPDRYRDFGRTYLAMVKDPSRLMFDVNVVGDRVLGTSPLPSPLATGAEFARLLESAAAPTGRAIVYAESTVTPQDWALASSVLASSARVTPRDGGWLVESPYAVAVRISTARTSLYLDGRPWPAFDNGSVIVPRGSHLLSFSQPFFALLDFDQLDLRLRWLSAELLSADSTSRGMLFSYTSPGRCIAVLNKQPYQVRVDGKNWEVAPMFSRGEWALPLPSGKHMVEVVASEPAVFAVELTSLLFSSLVVFFGVLSCGSMLTLYLFIRVRRAADVFRRRREVPVPEALT